MIICNIIKKVSYWGLLLIMGVSCNNNKKSDEALISQLSRLYNAREFSELREAIARVRKPVEPEIRFFVDSLTDYMRRYQSEYPFTEKDIAERLERKGIECTVEQMRQWEHSGQLECMLIDGKKRYFKNAPYNLVLLNDSLAAVAGVKGLNDDDLGAFCVEHIRNVLAESASKPPGETVCPRAFMLSYSLKVLPGNVTPGSMVSVWLPFGTRGSERQTDVKLLRSSVEDFEISARECPHQSVFLQKEAGSDGAAEFSIVSKITGKAQYFGPEQLMQSRFTTIPDTLLPYLAERPPHIVFSDRIKELADSLTDDGMLPFEMVKQFYYWIHENIPWARAVEYGLIDNISEYTLDHKHGDCGMQTLLFMTLCRYKGIPARWQSGWMLHPGHVNLHDWCQVWYDGVGWVPVDVSFKLQKSDDQRIREFYISGIDAYRFIVNEDYGRRFCPPKQWPRSEPWDFQRGEAEWKNGNLYFDDWTYNMDVKEL